MSHPGGGDERDVTARPVGPTHAQHGHPQQTQGGDEEAPDAAGKSSNVNAFLNSIIVFFKINP